MRISHVAVLALALPIAALAQLDDNTITVTSSRMTTIQPDQVVFSVTADFESTATLDDVLAAVQGAGITIANLNFASALPSIATIFDPLSAPAQITSWTFTITVPFSKMKDELSSLATLQQSIQENRQRTLSYSVQGTRVSSQLAASITCPYPGLVQDATAQAQAIAFAAGFALGPILSVEQTGSNQAVPTYAARAAFFYSGTPLALSAFLVGVPSPNLLATTPTACYLTATFKLIH